MTYLLVEAFAVGSLLGFIIGMAVAWREFLDALKDVITSTVEKSQQQRGPWDAK